MNQRHLSVFFLILLIVLLCLPAPACATIINPTAATTTAQLIRGPVTPVGTLNIVRVTTVAPQIGAVSIASSPSGATVIIDGATMGATPFTVRTLSVGSHSLVLQLYGYLDYSTTFVIAPDQLNQQSYTLTPVPVVVTTPIQVVAVKTPPPQTVSTTVTTLTTLTTVTTTPRPTIPQPTVTVVTEKPAFVPQVQAGTITEQLKALGPVTIEPLVVKVGSHKKTFIPDTLSPYFPYQFNTKGVTSPIGYHTPTVPTIPMSYIEVDKVNCYLMGSHLMSSVEMALDPIWSDYDNVYIKPTDQFFNNTNFRWISIDPDATAFYQISRNPFSDNASEWQNQYVTGLVASGPVKDVYVDKEGFHYFTLNFAPVANHNVADPPYYTGIAHLDPTVPGQGKPMGLAKIPFTASGFWFTTAKLGPVSIPVPNSIAQIPDGEITEQDLGNPNMNMILSDSSSFTPPSSVLGSLIADMDETYYVRVVPMAKNGSAGVPTIPVTVTVRRPQPCPATSPGDVKTDILVKPPSAQVSSFYMTLFIPDWVRTDQNGALVSRAHFVTVASPPYCSRVASGNSMTDSMNTNFCSMFGGSEPGYHFYADPAESHWYDTVWDIIKGMFMALSSVANSVSAAWNQINNLVVQIAAYTVQGLTFGAFDCNSSPACTGVLHAGLALAESSLGIPPTIPNAADLESIGADYVAKVAADQLGAGGVLDAAESAYGAMPDSAKETIKDNSAEIGKSLGDSLADQSAATVAGAAGNWYIPDPLYYRPHPATLIVKVSNPNGVATDPVSLTVKDSGGFYKPAGAMVPSLKPGDSTVIPLVLTEDFTKVYTPTCSADAYTSICDGSGGSCVPCYWENWQQAVRKSGTGSFTISLAAKKNGLWISGLNPDSSGRVLSSQDIFSFDEQGNNCPGYTSTMVLKYPAGWTMQQKTLSQDFNSVMWNGYTFTAGAQGRMISA